MKLPLTLAALVVALSTSAMAQNRGNFNQRGGQGGGVLPLPKGIDRVISIDAYNELLAEGTNNDGQRTYTPIIVRHVYSGGIAALFGGISIPTEQFISPGAGGRSGGGRGGFGVTSVGGGGNNNFNGGGNGFNGGGNNFNGNGNGFNVASNGNQGFGGITGLNNFGVNGGLSSAGNGQIFQTPDGGTGFTQSSIVNPDGTTTPLANGPFFPQ